MYNVKQCNCLWFNENKYKMHMKLYGINSIKKTKVK